MSSIIRLILVKNNTNLTKSAEIQGVYTLKRRQILQVSVLTYRIWPLLFNKNTSFWSVCS